MSDRALIIAAMTWLRPIFASLGVIAMLGVCAKDGSAGPNEDILYWGSASELETVTHYYDFRPEVEAISRLVWDRLFYREPNSPTYRPNLARKLVWRGITTVEIDLRTDIVFHNGDRFTADDIVETVRRLKDPDLGFPKHRGIEWIGVVEKVSRFKVRIDLKRPMPHLLEILSGPFVVIPRAAWQSAPLEASGRVDYSRMPPIGSGPYRVTRIEPGVQIELERFRSYHQSPKGKPRINRIVFSTVTDAAERRQHLMDGRLDFLSGLSKPAVDRMEREGAPVRVQRAPSMRIAFLAMDRAGRSSERTPLRKLMVRRAIAHAVNREELARLAFGPVSQVQHALCHPAQFGCTKDVIKYPYDPKMAVELLRAASIGPASNVRIVDQLNTFGELLPGSPPDLKAKPLRTINLDIVSYRNHPVSEAIARYLRAVGIDARVEAYSRFGTAISRLESGRLELAHMTWASHGAMDIAETLNRLFRNGALDYCRDAEVNRWLDVAANTNDRKVRLLGYSNALKRLQELACILPLYNYTSFYAHSKRLDFKPSLDDVLRFYLARWK